MKNGIAALVLLAGLLIGEAPVAPPECPPVHRMQLAAWVRELSHEDEAKRLAAFRALKKAGPQSARWIGLSGAG